ncbi:hypothetical protein [Methanomassiliicoccus luminyensis]|uniref:hypothetical protein n=1 Tax=Methanomassiliicoccus luminyensis TaxID=1080712 RepID=UPI00036FF925|nr:hypothetical protein [Methanomassiliicoccus luminyensis]
MNGDLLTGGFTAGLLSTRAMCHPWERADLTDLTYQYLLPPLKAGKVALRHGAVVALPEAGKTEMINDVAYHVRDFYGEDAVNIVFVDWLQDALDNMDDRPVQLLLVDDAVKKANSRKSGGNADDAADYFEIRHQFERLARTRTGVIILIYVTQRFKSLDIVFRNAMYLWFKTSTIDPDDRDIIKKYIGAQAYNDLEDVSARIYYHHDDEAKGRSIIHLPLERRTGWFRSTMRPRIIHLVGEQEARRPPAEIFTFDRMKVLEDLAKEPEWKKKVLVYTLADNGLTYDQIGEHPDVQLKKARISTVINQVRGKLSELSGPAYERWKAAQLAKEGWEVKRDGRRGKPDLVATMEEDAFVINCKCCEYRRPLIIDRRDLRPEIEKALQLRSSNPNVRVSVSVWNLWDMREQKKTFDPAIVPERIEFLPQTK